MKDVTQILSQIESGDPAAAEQLLPLVYDTLRDLAARKMAREAPDHTLQPTALVHEAYVRLVDVDHVQHWDNRRHFFSAAAESMRRILVEGARRKMSQKRGGDQQREELIDSQLVAPLPSTDLLALTEALERLSEKDPTKAELVKLRYFAGLTMSQAAELLGISGSTADRYWAYARAWLHQEVAKGDTSAEAHSP